MASLAELRAQIDETDEKIVKCLDARARLVLQVRDAKQKENVDIYSPERERQILERVAKLSEGGPFPKASLEKIFTEIVSATRSLVGELVVAFLAPQYSVAYEAAVKQFGERVKYHPGASVEDVFAKVERGDAHYGVVPAETNATGLLTSTFKLFRESSLNVIAEVGVKSRLCLLSQGASLREVKRVLSDVDSFSRAQAWLKANVPLAEMVVVESASAAASMISTGDSSAAIGSETIASSHQLKVLASGIEADAENTARFIVVGHTCPPRTGRDKTSLLCAAEDKPGVLCEILKPFQKQNLTLSKIESKPMSGGHVFFIDVVGHITDKPVAAAVESVQKLTSYFRLLGSYGMTCP